MNDPEYLAHVADRAEELAGQLHAALTKAIVERIMVRLRRGVNYRLTASDKWMLDILQDAGYLREDLMKELSARTGAILKEMSDAFEDAAVRNLAWDDAIYKAAGLSPAPLRQSPHLMRLVQRGYRKTAGEWRNFTGTLADRCQEKFISECDLAYNLTASHAMSYTQAVRQAVENVARDGVKVQYPSGHEDTIETATLRAVRTGVGQACGDITLARMEEMGWDIILVSAHLGARLGDGGENFTNHYWLQGKFYSLSGNDERFPPLSVCGIGDVRGLLGANCRHSIGPGDGEFNPFQHFDSEENRKRYELDQRQRLLERRIRATRREVMGLQAGGDLTDEKYRRKAALLQRQEEGYGAFCKENDLKMLYDRLAVAKYGPEQARAAERAARAGKTTLTSSQKDGIIDKKEQPREKPDVHTVGHIDKEKYKCVTEDIQTDEVIITDERIAHIKERHPNDFERYAPYIADMVEHPQYILEANKPNTAFLLKEYAENNERFQLILRLAVKGDVPGYKNSVITFLKVEEKRFKRYLRTKKTLYKAE